MAKIRRQAAPTGHSGLKRYRHRLPGDRMRPAARHRPPAGDAVDDGRGGIGRALRSPTCCGRGRADLAGRAVAARHDRRRDLQRAASRDPLQDAAPPGPTRDRPELRVAVADRRRHPRRCHRDAPDSPTGCSSPSRHDGTLSPAERLKTIYPRYLDAGPGGGHRPVHARLPRRYRVPGRRPDSSIRPRPSRSCSAAPVARLDARNVPARAADRRRATSRSGSRVNGCAGARAVAGGSSA